MTATLHVYEENALRAAAQGGLYVPESAATGNITFDASNPLSFSSFYSNLFLVCCTSTSSVFDASFNKPLKESQVVNGATVQTGLLDNGPVPLTYLPNQNNTFFYKTVHAYAPFSTSGPGGSVTTTAKVACWSTNGTNEVWLQSFVVTPPYNHVVISGVVYPAFHNRVPLLSGVRSVLLCANFGTATYNTQTLFQQSYALCMIDLGQTYGVANGTALTTNLQWTDNTIMRLQKTGP